MTNQWRDFLTTRSARIDAEGQVTFPEPTTPGDCKLFDLSHLGLIAVQGADAAGFLQGQLTNDIREISATHSQFSSHCSQKGRMLAVFRVMKLGDSIYLQTAAERLPDLIKRLSIFILRSKVTISDASNDLARVGIAGDRAPVLLAELGLPTPEHDNDLATCGEVTLIRIPGARPRFEILGPIPEIARLWDTLANQAVPANTPAWTLLDIEAGLPSIYNQTAEAFVPQMTNLQLIDGVSFRKGCYTGQEVVARMQYLGKLKRRMYLAEATTATVPRPGDELFSPSSTSQQASGRVVDASPLADGRHALLVVAEISAAEHGEIRLGEEGPVLTLRNPPYGFPREDTPAS
jgi:tRNA-modifying protein YgfZ